MFTGPDKCRRQSRGLTLLEVVVGLAILSLMAGAIYAIVAGSVESTAALAIIQRDDRRTEAFLERARTAFAHLPEGATLELRVLEAEPLRQELTLRGAGHAFVWGERGGWERAVVTLAPLPWPEDQAVPVGSKATVSTALQPRRHSLAMTVPDFYRTDSDGEPLPDSLLRSRQGHQLLKPDQRGRFWLDLLPEVIRVEWRFYDPAKKIWVEQQDRSRPPLIELRLLLPGRTAPLRAVFETT